jgi:tRNA G18 (ribose-2'-O)-methylase SpoU
MKYLILENIRSAYNVGAIFRTADGAGVSKIFLVGYTPTPIDRFGREQSEIAKTSLGASLEIEWEQIEDIKKLVSTLQAEGFVVVAVEQGIDTQSITTFSVPEKVAYIMGNEVGGVSASTLDAVDLMVDIPMLGMKESLNVSVAAGIIMYHGMVIK